ncbi:PPK2 family polyphosphate kinase [Nesterenkonia lutea]|uniref:PPK2 family polyphosphate:nucleotide phosphotransferase n=1 Tax=Nesterenkonia lutea TaxID=272919 RepID=A0ABR9JEP0_9MICC|nr:PPK2 family polyphosphate kinase [Nesterenkonia lutea]MBE1524394.1 PPK2 family polyphosphate:nucleotide phosphotransferase [Nesterenkonia lutea]
MPKNDQNPAPLDVSLTGVRGPKGAKKTPFEGDPRSLWRVSQFASPFSLPDAPTRKKVGFKGKKDDGEDALAERAEMLADLQELMWAHVVSAPEAEQREVAKAIAARVPRRSPQEKARREELFSPEVESALSGLARGPRVLLILQGMDAAGKGGVVKQVVSSMDPMGVEVAGFGKPTPEENGEHYLERVIRRLPRPGHVGVFDRSHYEDVLVPTITGSESTEELERRTEALKLFELELVRQGFVIIKVMLHVSPEEQLDRLISRLDREEKHWKYDPSDADSRAQFSLYQSIHAYLLEATDADHAPWHVIGADRKWYSRLAVQELLIAAFADLNLRWPAADYDVETERKRLLES